MPRGGITVRITGGPRLQRRLEDLPEELIDACKVAIRESAEAVRDGTERRVPVDTGQLNETVAIRYEDDDLTAQVGWHDEDSYYAAFLEHGTRSQPAQPSLQPSLEEERGRFRGRLSAEVRRAIG